MASLFTSESIISFVILVILEIVLGIDNVIFVSIIINQLQKKDEGKARATWMIAGILIRSMLLLGLGWLLAQKGKFLFTIFKKGFDVSGLVMLAGGLFLIYKSVREIHKKLEGDDASLVAEKRSRLSLGPAILQIILIDTVFSFDSILTAGGTAKRIEVMIAAVAIAMVIMFLFSPRISEFIHKHPTLKMLALSFLVLIGLGLVIEGWDSQQAEQIHLKNYIYFGMAFSFVVELLNMSMRRRMTARKVIELNEPMLKADEQTRSDQAH